jgi:Flp pilus assembly protein TadG
MVRVMVKTGRRRKGLHRDRRGAVAVMVGLSLPVLIGSAGLATDVSFWYTEASRLQLAADAGAMNAAYLLYYTTSPAALAAAAQTGVQQMTGGNLIGMLNGAPTINVSYNGTTPQVTVTLSSSANLFFTQMFLPGAVQMSAVAGVQQPINQNTSYNPPASSGGSTGAPGGGSPPPPGRPPPPGPPPPRRAAMRGRPPVRPRPYELTF